MMQTFSVGLVEIERFSCPENDFFLLTDRMEIDQRVRKVAIQYRRFRERCNNVDLDL